MGRDTKLQFQFFPETGNKKEKLSLNTSLLGKNTQQKSGHEYLQFEKNWVHSFW